MTSFENSSKLIALWLGSAAQLSAFPAKDGLNLGNVMMSDGGILRRDLHVTVNLHISLLAGTLQTLSDG